MSKEQKMALCVADIIQELIESIRDNLDINLNKFVVVFLFIMLYYIVILHSNYYHMIIIAFYLAL